MYVWQEEAFNSLVKARQSQRLPHALLLTSKAGYGADTWLHEASQWVLCAAPTAKGACHSCRSCQLFVAQNHPDYYWIETAEDKKQISISQIRELSSNLTETAAVSTWRLAVIFQAEKMTIAGYNALLKTLEEPGDDVLLMLYTAERNSLPATIISRCQHLHLDNDDVNVSRQWLTQECPEASPDELNLALALTHNAPLAAKAMLEAGEIEAYKQAIQVLVDVGLSKRPFWEAQHSGIDDQSFLQSWEFLCSQVIKLRQNAPVSVPALQNLIGSLAELANVQLLFKLRDEILFQLKQLKEGVSLNLNMQTDALAKQWQQAFQIRR
ncbi:hypothetical protein [Pleionea litopenaei]|uniref:DNA-directed DNA polymerase n=1 Tax=Pleionea litopenaei TaxID=3070815 RepID=A0AA51RUG1_9GAMM|nr:hypothetical protein [Pleionea sp. HL-JVS1]WMS87725.1 hypothetical protein Q9312_02090 [Pleionea sp. HL-JVS1]